jgi:ABC-2 type transport system ATP-binding protein
MELVERLCDHVAIVHRGRLVAQGTVGEFAGGGSLEDAFVEAVGGEARTDEEGLAWLGSQQPDA